MSYESYGHILRLSNSAIWQQQRSDIVSLFCFALGTFDEKVIW